jgi:PHD/YefM family antitoxin component YafN of YafNO toxin-antitoxin module
MLPPSEFLSMERTLQLLRSPRNAERLLEAVRGAGAACLVERTLPA